ncbi:MAG TPA: CdvA-like protein [Nitrososphaeraceae archaeon]|jgi:CdvA-like coiled-coil domain|nr:CdvA-like protein [Nitrososphaeraceae archaeon]
MSEFKLEFIGKQVKDLYGTLIGKVMGMVTDIDASIESISVDCGTSGLKQLAYEQLLVQGDYVIYIPKWRLDAQKLLRQKSLTLQRIRALQDIATENDSMKDDVELVYIKYDKRLHDLEENANHLNGNLESRLKELEEESRSIKTILFDAKLQFRSNEMTEEIYQQINIYTSELLEHINLEKTEINNVKTKLSQQTLENNNILTITPNSKLTENQQNPTKTAKSTQSQEEESIAVPQTVATTATVNTSEIKGKNTPEIKGKIAEDEEGKNSNGEREENWLNQVINE